jgi:hypothetical protein
MHQFTLVRFSYGDTLEVIVLTFSLDFHRMVRGNNKHIKSMPLGKKDISLFAVFVML